MMDGWYNPKTEKKRTSSSSSIKHSFQQHTKKRGWSSRVQQNTKPTDPAKRIRLRIYFKNKTSHLLLRKNSDKKSETIQKSHVIYRFTCKWGNCKVLPSTHVGMTMTKLSWHLTYHLTTRAPKKHQEEHGTTITRKILEESTDVIDICKDVRCFPILEALYIKDLDPKLNTKAEDLQTLSSLRRKMRSSSQSAVTVGGQDTETMP